MSQNQNLQNFLTLYEGGNKVAAVAALTSSVNNSPNDAPNRWRPIAQNTRHQSFPTNVPASINPTAGLIKQGTGRWWHPLINRPGAQVARMRVRLPNVGAGVNGNTEANGLTPLTLTLSIEFNAAVSGPYATGTAGAQLVQATFNGQTSVTLPVGPGYTESDDIIIPFAQLTGFYTKPWAQSGSSTDGAYLIPIGYEINTSNFEGVNFGDVVSTLFTNGNGATYTATPSGAGSSYPGGVILSGTAMGTGGNTNASITSNADGTFPVTGNIAAGSTVSNTTGALSLNFVTAPPTGSFATARYYLRSGGTDETMVLAPTDLHSYTFFSWYGPCEIVGTLTPNSTVRNKGILIVGDSVDTGTGNNPIIGIGYPDACIGTSIGIVKISQPNESANFFAQTINNYRRLKMTRGEFDRAICGHSTNDVGGQGQSFLQLQASFASINALLLPYLEDGVKGIWWRTMLPRTTNNSSQTPFNNNAGNYGPGTVASGAPSIRNAWNAFLFAQAAAGNIGGVLDIAAAVEGNPASAAGAGDGTWANLNMTFDGTHPSAIGVAAIATMFGVNGTNPSPAFIVAG